MPIAKILPIAAAVAAALAAPVASLFVWIDKCDAGVSADDCDKKKRAARNAFIISLFSLVVGAIGYYLKYGRAKSLTGPAPEPTQDSTFEYKSPITVRGRRYSK